MGCQEGVGWDRHAQEGGRWLKTAITSGDTAEPHSISAMSYGLPLVLPRRHTFALRVHPQSTPHITGS